MIQIPYFSSEEIEKIINNKEDLTNYFKENNVNENPILSIICLNIMSELLN